MKIDLHTHPIPKPGFLEKMVDRCIKAGMSIVAITDVGDNRYDFFRDYVEHKRYAPGYIGFLSGRSFRMGTKEQPLSVKFIHGQEVLTQEGHVLTVGAKERIPDDQPLEDTLKRAQDSDAIIIADHPFVQVPLMGWNSVGEKNLLKYSEYWDGIEWNAQCINLSPYPKLLNQAGANQQAEEFAKKHEIPLVADSDAHFTSILGFGGSLKQIGLAYIRTPYFQYSGDNEFILALRSKIKVQEYTNVKTSISRWHFSRWAGPLALKKLAGKVKAKFKRKS